MLFCCYSSAEYLPKLKICHGTLMKYSPNSILYVMLPENSCIDQVSKWKNTIIIKLDEIEKYQPKLLNVKKQRSFKEYIATITPILPQYIMDKFNKQIIWYTDADMCFWNPVEEMENVLGNHSLLITPHEHPHAKPAGLFNVGILGYRNDQKGRAFLKWWENKCLDWCEWRALPDGRCADQGYLTEMVKRQKEFNVKISDHPGINLGPWNLALHTLEKKGEKLVLDADKNLISYHFHGYNSNKLNDTGWEVSEKNLELLYRPYKEMLDAIL